MNADCQDQPMEWHHAKKERIEHVSPSVSAQDSKIEHPVEAHRVNGYAGTRLLN